jgi:hypothetical protein
MGDRHKQPSSHLRLRGDAFHILRHPLVVRARSETNMSWATVTFGE